MLLNGCATLGECVTAGNHSHAKHSPHMSLSPDPPPSHLQVAAVVGWGVRQHWEQRDEQRSHCRVGGGEGVRAWGVVERRSRAGWSVTSVTVGCDGLTVW